MEARSARLELQVGMALVLGCWMLDAGRFGFGGRDPCQFQQKRLSDAGSIAAGWRAGAGAGAGARCTVASLTDEDEVAGKASRQADQQGGEFTRLDVLPPLVRACLSSEARQLELEPRALASSVQRTLISELRVLPINQQRARAPFTCPPNVFCGRCIDNCQALTVLELVLY